MFLFIALVLVTIWVSVISWVYWIINPFTQELWNIQRYNIAWYWAIASIERAELVLRWHIAWFEWSWGWLGWNTYWNESDYKDIQNKKYRWWLSFTWVWNWIFWKIENMTDWIIPATGQGDLDPDISSGNDYKKLTFDKSLQYAFYKDTTTNTDWYYTWVEDGNIDNIKIDWLNGLKISIRVPQKLYNKYDAWAWWNALDVNSDKDLDWDWVNDDIIVNRSLFWYTGDDQFTIFPSINLNVDGDAPADNDTAIRETVINHYVDNNNVVFNTSTSTKDTNPCSDNDTANVIEFNQSPDWAVSTGFDVVLNNANISKMHLKLSLVNYLRYSDNEVYPYLEVRLEAWTPIPDLDFHILWEGKVSEYDVKIILTKPVFETTAASDFTVLF